MDQKVCEASKRLNNLLYQKTEREARYQDKHTSLDRMLQIDAQDFDFERKRVRGITKSPESLPDVYNYTTARSHTVQQERRVSCYSPEQQL